MKDGTSLGELEELVLLAIVFLGNNAYGIEIMDVLNARANRGISFGTVYSTLDALHHKFFIDSYKAEKTAVPGGRARTYYQVNDSGHLALEIVKRRRDALSRTS